jgi:hypothetical protein
MPYKNMALYMASPVGAVASNAPGERRPTVTAPRMSTEPALWAVRSTGWLGMGRGSDVGAASTP